MRPAGGGTRALVVAVALAALAACARTTSQPAPAGSGPAAVGYVRMDELVQKHPLYDQLARYDRSIEAFDLSATAPRLTAQDPQLRARERELEKQLDAAATRTKKLLDQKQQQYQQQESQAIAAALQGAGSAGPSAAEIAGRVDATARQQRVGVAATAQRDLEAYRRTLQRQDQAQIAAAQRAFAQRAERTYRAKADELQSKESALSLKMANDDAPERLSLRTRLTSLALDDAAREDAQKRLAAIDRREADALGALRNRDQQMLAALQAQLHADVERNVRGEVAAVEKRSSSSLAQRQQTLTAQTPALGGPVVKTTVVGGRIQQQVNPNLPPALRSRIERLHQDYQKRFADDARVTVADFQKTRADLGRRYAELHGADATGRRGAQTQILALRKKRDDLYDQIRAQIGREVRLIAQQRGIGVVLTNVVAPAGGVDLTPDALKDIESLHE